MATWTETGLSIDGIVEIREKLNQAGKLRFKDLLKDGEELSVDDASVIGRQYGVLAEVFASMEEVIFDGFSNLDPTQASGSNLDDALNITTFKRQRATGSIVPLMFLGVLNTTLSKGASVKSNITGDAFITSSAIEFKSNECNGVQINIENLDVKNVYKIEYSVQGNASTNAPITISPSVSDTISTFTDRIIQTVVQQTSDLFAERVSSGVINIYNINRTALCSFNVSNLTIKNVFKLQWCKGVNGDEGEQDAFTVNVINGGSNINWISATNPYISYGRLTNETDDEFRNRWKYYKSYFSYGNYDAMMVGLKAVEGVTYANIQQNITSKANGERINNGISVIVLGGTNDEIAQAVYNKLSVGTATNGSEYGMAVDVYGNQHRIYFSRPTYAPIQISMNLKALPNFPQNGKNLIKQQLIDYFNTLEVGEDILYSRLYNPINNVTGFSINNLKISRKTQTLSQGDVTIKYNELATLSADDILIGGS